MKALSIRQPWAWLICSGIKDVENRGWPTAVRGRVYVHAGRTMDVNIPSWRRGGGVGSTEEWILDRLTPEQRDAYHSARRSRGAIIGEVEIVNCRYRHGENAGEDFSMWHAHGSHGFYLEDAVLYAEPIPCKGRLGMAGWHKAGISKRGLVLLEAT